MMSELSLRSSDLLRESVSLSFSFLRLFAFLFSHRGFCRCYSLTVSSTITWLVEHCTTYQASLCLLSVLFFMDLYLDVSSKVVLGSALFCTAPRILVKSTDV